MPLVILATILVLLAVLISLGKQSKIVYSINQIAGEFSVFQNSNFDWNVYLEFLRLNFSDEIVIKLFMNSLCFNWFSKTYAVGLEGWDDKSTKLFIEKTFLCK